MNLTINKSKVKGQSRFCVDCPELPGSPIVGYGESIAEAIGNWVIGNTDKVGLSFTLDDATTKFKDRSNAVKMGLHR